MADERTSQLTAASASPDFDSLLNLSEETAPAVFASRKITLTEIQELLGFSTIRSVASASAFIAFTNLGAGSFEIIGENLVPATTGNAPIVEVSTDNGSTWKSTGYKSTIWVTNSSGGSAIGTSTTVIYAGSNISSGSGFNGYFNLKFSGLDGSVNYKQFDGIWSGLDGSTQSGGTMSSSWQTGTPINAVRVLMTAGNIASGTLKLRKYGVN